MSLKVTGSLRADTCTVYLIKHYFIGFLSPKIKPCDPTWIWKTVYNFGTVISIYKNTSSGPFYTVCAYFNTTLDSKDGNQDGGYSYSRVVLSKTVQPSHKTLPSRLRASYGASPNSRIKLLAVFALEIFGE